MLLQHVSLILIINTTEPATDIRSPEPFVLVIKLVFNQHLFLSIIISKSKQDKQQGETHQVLTGEIELYYSSVRNINEVIHVA